MIKVLSFLNILLILSSCKGQTVDTIPEHETFKIDSKEVGELRTINVWLPEDYKTSDLPYPVLYMPDGGVQEDFPHIANTLSELIQAKKVPPFILVGIENTQRRKDLTPPTQVEKDKEIAPVVGGSHEFRNFIENELMPYINSNYRTTDEKGIIGESLAGLFVTETLMVQPDLFDFYIAFDPSLWWNDKYLLKNSGKILTEFTSEPKRFWFAGSGAKDISKSINNLAKEFEKNAPKNLIWNFSDEPKEKHNTIFRATKEKAMVWALNKLN